MTTNIELSIEHGSLVIHLLEPPGAVYIFYIEKERKWQISVDHPFGWSAIVEIGEYHAKTLNDSYDVLDRWPERKKPRRKQ